MSEYDLIVIGSGPAGEKGAAQAAYFKKKVALVEKERVVGGACVNTGTIPSKTLRESALHLSGFRQRGLFGVDLAVKRDISVNDFMYRKQQVVEKEWDLIEENLRRHHITRYRGGARFLSNTEIEVDNGSRKFVITGDFILIATGSSPLRPPAIPFNDRVICDSDSILNLDSIPRSLAVVGAGVIGCEYATIFAAMGVDVHLIDGRAELLGHVDREVADALQGEMQKRLYIDVRLGSDVRSIDATEDRVKLELNDGTVIETEKALFAIGRISNTEGLNLAAAGVETGNRGLIAVNDHYQTSISNIYAAGDVIGFPALASTSMEQARVAMVHAFNLGYKTRVAALLPYGIFTIPELSMVGLTEQQCLEKGIDYEIGRASFRNNARGQIIGDTEGLIKLVFEAGTLKILGVHIVGENASELLHVGMMAMQFGGTINAFIESVFNYPTLGDAYKYAAYDGLGKIALRRAKAVAGSS